MNTVTAHQRTTGMGRTDRVEAMGQAESTPWAKIGPMSFLFLSNFIVHFKFLEIQSNFQNSFTFV
jgi:hypothetical protein